MRIGQSDKARLGRAIEDMHRSLGAEPFDHRPRGRVERAAATKNQTQRRQWRGCTPREQPQLRRRGIEDRRPRLGNTYRLSPGRLIRQDMRVKAEVQRLQHGIERQGVAEMAQHSNAIATAQRKAVGIHVKAGDPRGLAAAHGLGLAGRAAGEGKECAGRAGDVIGQRAVAEAKGGLLADRCGKGRQRVEGRGCGQGAEAVALAFGRAGHFRLSREKPRVLMPSEIALRAHPPSPTSVGLQIPGARPGAAR